MGQSLSARRRQRRSSRAQDNFVEQFVAGQVRFDRELFEQAADYQERAALFVPGGEDHIRHWQDEVEHMERATQALLSQVLPPGSVAQVRLQAENLVALTLHDSLKYTLIQKLSEFQLSHVTFELTGLAETVEHLQAAGIIRMDDIVSCGTEIGQDFNRLTFIGDGIFVNAALVAAIVDVTVALNHLEFYFGAEEAEDAEQLAELTTLITGRDDIQYLAVVNGRKDTILRMCRTMLTLPNLFAVVVNGSNTVDNFKISSAADAGAIADVLAKPSLEAGQFYNFQLDTDEVTDIVLAALSASSLKHVWLQRWLFPTHRATDLARALVHLNSLELNYFSAIESDFLPKLGRGLAEDSMTTQTLGLSPRYQTGRNAGLMVDSGELNPFFHKSEHWRLCELLLVIKDWDDAFDAALARYVGSNAHLRRLTIHLGHNDGKEVFSHALIKAIDSPSQCVETINLDGPFSRQFKEQVQHILDLNRLRVEQAPHFLPLSAMQDGTARRICLLDAIGALDVLMLYEFIRRDQWSLRTLIRESCWEKERSRLDHDER